MPTIWCRKSLAVSCLDNTEIVRKPLSYLYGIAAHVVHEFRMRAAREQEFVMYDSPTADFADALEGPRAANAIEEQLHSQQQLEQLLKRLPRLHRAVLLLIKRDGLSHEEAAAVTRLHVRTVERYVVDAMAQLRAMHIDR